MSPRTFCASLRTLETLSTVRPFEASFARYITQDRTTNCLNGFGVSEFQDSLDYPPDSLALEAAFLVKELAARL